MMVGQGSEIGLEMARLLLGDIDPLKRLVLSSIAST
jgi:hypothetical protein